MNTLGIRREDKNEWERRVPVTPALVARLTAEGIAVRVQPSPIRVYPDAEYAAAGAVVDEDLSPCQVVLGVKEMPLELFQPRTAYLFFSHTIKGQSYNMPMLAKMMEQRVHLIDYERIVDDKGRRLVMFGRFAGLAGMIDTLWAYGQRLAQEGFETPLAELRPAHTYPNLNTVLSAVQEAGLRVEREGWPQALGPVVCGFAGYGNVSQGAQEVFAYLDPQEITPGELLEAVPGAAGSPFVKVVFHEKHMVASNEGTFALQDYYDHPERYRPDFERFLPKLSILVNAIYWDARYPRLLTLDFLRREWGRSLKNLRVIGDITCDIGGAVECTVKATDPGAPVYVYEPGTGAVRDGFEGDGPVIEAVDTLPCELPRESSEEFSAKLEPYLVALARLDVTASFEAADLPEDIRRATLLWNGRPTRDYAFLADYVGGGS
jgi:alpha-aminoadipic semialdehyde synthase